MKSQGVAVYYAPHGANGDAWRGGRSFVNQNPPEINIWPTAFEHYGWDIVTSVLIHEFGHCKLYEAEGICDDSIEAERKANEYGFRLMLPELIPARYEEYREFFLRSYENSEAYGTKDKFLQAFEHWSG